MTFRDFSRRAGHVFHALFGMPFLGAGLFVLFLALRQAFAPAGTDKSGAPPVLLLAIFGLVFAGVGGAFVVSGLRKAFGPTPHEAKQDSETSDADTPTPSALPKPKGQSKTAATLVPLLFGGVFAAAGMGMLVFGGYKVKQVGDAKSWVETPCTVISSQVTSHRGSKGGSTYAVAVKFAYSYANRPYTSDSHSFDSGSSSGYEDKADIVRALPPGKRTVCYVNPADPAEAVMDRSIPFIAWMLGGMGSLFAIAGFAVMSAPLYARRQKARELASGKGVELVTETGRGTKLLGLLFFTLFWNGGTSVFVTLAVKSHLANRPDWFLTVFITPFVLIGIGCAIGTVFSLFSLFQPRIRLTPTETPRAGGKLRLKWDAQGREASLRKLVVSLEGFEYDTVTSGKKNSVREIIFHRITILDTQGRPARPGTLEADLPRELPHSFDLTATSGVRWRIRVKSKCGAGPALDETFLLRVLPAAPESNPFAE